MIITPFLNKLFPSASKDATIRKLESQNAEKAETLQLKDNIILAQSSVIQANISVGNVDDADATDKHYTGNPYPSYVKKVVALTRMYDGKKDWGCDVAKNVVDVRAAFLIGSGVQVVKSEHFKGSATRELEFVNKFISFNNINEEIPQEWSKYAEIEGKFLVEIKPTENNIKVIHKPWIEYSYWVDYSPDDYGFYIRASSDGTSKSKYPVRSNQMSRKPQDIGKPFDLTPDAFVYKRFGGSASQVNETPSKTALVLRNIQDLDKASWDWRKINHLYASPTPVFECETPEGAKLLRDDADFKNWRIGKAIVLANAELKLICYVGEGYTTVKDEIQSHARKISGATGVPVHFFGYPDLLSNRDTADNLVEGIVLSTNKERKTWVGFYQELFRKAILMHNKTHQQDLNPDAIDAKIPAVSSAKMVEIEKVWLPMYINSAISIETLLDQLGDVETENEIERIKREAVPRMSNPGNGGGENNSNDSSGRNGKNKGK